MNLDSFRFDGSRKFKIDQFDTKQEGSFKDKTEAQALREDHIMDLQGLQERLYA